MNRRLLILLLLLLAAPAACTPGSITAPHQSGPGGTTGNSSGQGSGGG